MALLIVGTSTAYACPVDVTTPLPASDLKISATGDAFVQYLGSAKAILVTDEQPASSSDESARTKLAPVSSSTVVAPALIPLPPAVWTGMVGLGAVAMRSFVSKVRRR